MVGAIVLHLGDPGFDSQRWHKNLSSFNHECARFCLIYSILQRNTTLCLICIRDLGVRRDTRRSKSMVHDNITSIRPCDNVIYLLNVLLSFNSLFHNLINIFNVKLCRYTELYSLNFWCTDPLGPWESSLWLMGHNIILLSFDYSFHNTYIINR